jgi:hypothetical protein
MLPNHENKREKYLLTFRPLICYHHNGDFLPPCFVSFSSIMTPQTDLELQGNFLMHPAAELIAEIGQSRLNGSLRLADKDKKCILYFKSGMIVFAVSNARSARLFDILMRRNKLKREDLVHIPNFANDLEFSSYLLEKHFLTKQECDRLFTDQIEGIIVDVLSWTSGDWTFSSLARIRDGLAYPVNTIRLLVDYGRTMQVDRMLSRFRSLNESFRRSAESQIIRELTPEEAFVLSRATDGPLTAESLVSVAGMSEAKALHVIYTLWLGGLLTRNDWQPAFSKESIHAMNSAKLEIRREAKLPGVPEAPKVEETAPEPAMPAAEKPMEPSITLEDYLERVENAATYYDILGVDSKAETDELKRAYFSLARMFHPDRYHADGGETLKRVQNAFTSLAQAHETLKTTESRDVYDYRMRKELADREKREAVGNVGNAGQQVEQAAENFDRGFSLLMDHKHEEALPFLARAVHFAPKNARYHAYYGKALSFDDKQRHKAEAEMQAALKIDQNNPTFRILLAEFFIQVNLLKRAEGELTRLLAVFPSNRDARELLDSLKAKA